MKPIRRRPCCRYRRSSARARQFALLVAADVQPLTGLRVMSYLRDACRMDVAARGAGWFSFHWLMEGLDAVELWLTASERGARFCVGG
ncbi:MAG: hypothetical protein IPN13_08050 [Bacteroidetes bacterium]|nr:hypothetical protein [Bacteroidota bacterium]